MRREDTVAHIVSMAMCRYRYGEPARESNEALS